MEKCVGTQQSLQNRLQNSGLAQRNVQVIQLVRRARAVSRRPHQHLAEFRTLASFALATKRPPRLAERFSVSKRIYALGQGVCAGVAVCRLRQACGVEVCYFGRERNSYHWCVSQAPK